MAVALPLNSTRQFKVHGKPVWHVKVSHHGPWHRRWRPLARVLAEKRGPIPDGYLVNHRDCDPSNIEPEKLVFPRADHFKIVLRGNPNAATRQRTRRARAVRRNNTMRARIDRSQFIKRGKFYPVISFPGDVIQTLAKGDPVGWVVMIPCRTKHQAEVVGRRPEFKGCACEGIRGHKIETDPGTILRLAGYVRHIPDDGQAWIQKRTLERRLDDAT